MRTKADTEPNSLAWAISFHEASHAVIAHLLFGVGSIKQVEFDFFNFEGCVRLRKEHTFTDSDFLRIIVTMAGDMGTRLYADNYMKELKKRNDFNSFSKADTLLVKEIARDRYIEPSAIRHTKKRLKTCLALPMTKKIVSELAALLYRIVYNTCKVHTIMKGAAVQKQIIQSLSAIATEVNLALIFRAIILLLCF